MAELQNFITTFVDEYELDTTETDSVLLAIKSKFNELGNVDVNWKNEWSDLYIMNVSNKSNLNSAFVRKCNGTIFDQNTHKVVCYSFPVFLDETEMPLPLPEGKINMESMYDGTLMKLFFHPSTGKWETATVKCFDASKSRWSSVKSFHDLFVEAVGKDFNYAGLDRNKCYIGILIHPENKLVTDYYNGTNSAFKTPMFVHTGTCNLETLEFENDYEKLNSNTVIRPEKFEFENVEEMKRVLADNVGQPIRPGFVYFDHVSGERYKFMSPRYTEFKTLRGNIQNMKYRLLEMQGNNAVINKFLESFPEYKKLNTEVEQDVAKLATNVFRNYSNYYFKHLKDKRMPSEIFEIVKAVNWKYKEDLEKVGGDKSRVPTNPETIAYFLVTRYPFEHLANVLGYYQNNNHRPSIKPTVRNVGRKRANPGERGK